MKINVKRILSVVSTVATVTGLVANLVTSIANDKKQQIEINEAVAKRLAEQKQMLLLEMNGDGSK